MTEIQPRKESAGENSEEEPLRNLVKPGRTRVSKETSSEDASLEETTKEPVSTAEASEDSSLKETSKEPVSTAEESPTHSSDDEPLSKLIKPKKSITKRSDTVNPSETESSPPIELVKELIVEPSDSEDEQPLNVIKQKQPKKKPDKEEPAVPDAKKTKSPKKRKMEVKAAHIRDSTPLKVSEKRGKKTLCTESLLMTNVPQMKKVVVLLKRLSQQDIKNINQRHKQEKKSTVKSGLHVVADPGSENAEISSDEEPLSRKLKRLKKQKKLGRGRKAAAEKGQCEDDERSD